MMEDESKHITFKQYVKEQILDALYNKQTSQNTHDIRGMVKLNREALKLFHEIIVFKGELFRESKATKSWATQCGVHESLAKKMDQLVREKDELFDEYIHVDAYIASLLCQCSTTAQILYALPECIREYAGISPIFCLSPDADTSSIDKYNEEYKKLIIKITERKMLNVLLG